MSEKSELYQALKQAGVDLSGRPYVQYTVQDLKDMAATVSVTKPEAPVYEEGLSVFDELDLLEDPEPYPGREGPPPETAPPRRPVPPTQPRPAAPQRQQPPARPLAPLADLQARIAEAARTKKLVEGVGFPWPSNTADDAIRIPVQNKGADRAGLTHSVPMGQPIRIDTNGRIWFRDEVQKPAVPKPRMTRKTRETSTGVKQLRTYRPDGRLDEIIEVAGDDDKEITVTTTLPSWQVGRYLDPRFPFQVHTYNGEIGFDYMEVIRYFGGRDLVPRSIKTLYIGNQSCYSIASTREVIESQYNALQRRI